MAKPDVDFVFGLSPVISIEQKTLTSNPRSTVGTMTDIASYLNLLYATIADPHCPRTGDAVPSRSASQIVESILALPEGTEVELRAPVFKVNRTMRARCAGRLGSSLRCSGQLIGRGSR